MTELYLQKVLKDCVDRRDFLKMMGILGIGLATPALATPLESLKFNKNLYKVSRTRLLMGTFVNIIIMDSSKDKAEDALERTFLEMESLTCILNRHADNTPISQLNRKGILRDVSPDIYKVMSRADYFYQLSGGAFDITVKPLIDLYEESFTQTGSPPDVECVKDILRLIDAKNVHYDGEKIEFLKDGMGITLDGIAKGYIVDKAAHFLKKAGIEHALINAGGDIKAIGNRGRGKPWRIGIRDPWKKDKNLEVLSLANEAIATSGNYEVYFDREKLFHHILNPKTGYSPRSTTSVTVLAKAVTDADALSTATFIFEPKEGKRFVDSISGAECLIVDGKGMKIRSSGWPVA
ncbi:MAG TPA: FAD:protein FMN transferase [Syntrophaceae bacterium]|nr:FAD:protein FMN transferase [Syntrophaceae bacterium]